MLDSLGLDIDLASVVLDDVVELELDAGRIATNHDL